MVERLLKLGADVNVQNDTWNTSNVRLTALEAAIWSGNTDLCKLLLEAGANPDLQSGFEGSALALRICLPPDHEVAGWLLDYGADPFLKKQATTKPPLLNWQSPKATGNWFRGCSARKERAGCLETGTSAAVEKNSSSKTNRRRRILLRNTAQQLLSAAAQRGELEAVEALLKAGVSAKTNAPGELPLLQAFAISEAAAVKARPSAIAQWQQTSNKLKSFGPTQTRGFTASIRSQEAEQAARVACLAPERWMKIRDLLIKNGADYDAFAATAMADTNRAAQLLATDKNVVQARDRDGQTPLHWAVLNDQLPLTSFWLQAGASPAATNFAGQTPLHIAATKGLS